jgi:hypothetical protein
MIHDRLLPSLLAFARRQGGAVLVGVVAIVTAAGLARADVPGRALPAGAVPNPGTQQQELTNITAPAEWNVFEFVVTCGACHAGTVDQHVGHFGNWAGGNMASAARDPIFRANQITVNNTVKAVTGQDGAGNVCFRCHSPNGWLSGRFDPSLGGKPDGSSMIQSILLSTDGEGVMCETCHRAVGNVTYQRPDVAINQETGVLDKVWNLLSSLFEWQHEGHAPIDQAGTQTLAAGNPYGDTSLQFLDGMTYVGKYSGMTDVYFSDLPIGGSYTGQIYAVYPDWWTQAGNPMNPVPAGKPAQNSAGQYLAYNLDGTLSPLLEVPVGTPINVNTGYGDQTAQAFSIEHPTVGGTGRKTSPTDTVNNLLPVLPTGNGGSPSPNNFIRSSEMCGSCHELTVPVLNHGMPEQRTFSEWKYSAYSKPGNVIVDPLNKRTGTGVERCQDCHMPTLKHEYTDLDPGSYNADPWLVGGFPYGKNRSAQGGTAFHKLTGANRDLPQMMKILYPEVDLEVIGAPTGKDPRVFPGMLSDRGPMFDRATQNTEITLRDGVDVGIIQAPTEVAGQPGIYEMKVRVTNKSGHRIPSGYPDGRRFWLSVNVKDAAAGSTVYQSGVYDQANAELQTAAGVPFNRALGNVIDATTANAVMVYERVTGTCTDAAGAAIFPDALAGTPANCASSPSLLNNFILFDNRIPPKGLDYAQARLSGVKFWNYDAATKVPAEDVSRFSADQLAGGYDEVTYRFAAAPGAVLTASAEIYWQTHTREFMEHLRTSDTSTVRPEGPPNPLDPNYPMTPNYLANSINGQPLSAYTALDGTPLNDNWGGIAYASWLATGKGAPFMVDRDDTAVTAAPAAPVVTVRALNGSDPDYIDPVTLAPDMFTAKIEWTPVPDADGYMIWVRYGKSDATADWDRMAVVGKDVSSHTEHVLGDASVGSPGKTYGFKVVAFNGKGEAASAVVEHKVATALPAAPSNMTASNSAPGSTGSRITLTWNDNATNEAGFEIWRYGPMSINGVPQVYTGLPPVTIIGPAAAGGIATQTGGPAVVGQPTTGLNTYVDSTGLAPNTCYNYQVRAVTANVDVSTFALAPTAGCTVVAAPTVNLAAAATGYRVDLSWTGNLAGVAAYQITRAPAFAPTATVALAGTASVYADTTVQPATAYTYTLTALDKANAVLATATATVTTPAVPVAPTGAKATVSGTQVTVTWKDNAANEDGYVVERATVSGGVVGAFQQVPGVGAFLAPNTQQFVDVAPIEGSTLVYRVKAINLVNGDSQYAVSNQVVVGLYAPTNLVAAAAVPPPASTAAVTLSWFDASQKETAYKVERKIGNGAWTTLNAALPANSQQYLDSTVPTSTKAQTVQYRVTATGTGVSSQAVTVSVSIPAKAAVPGSLKVATGTTAGTVKVSFSAATSATGYEIRRATASNGPWTNIVPVTAGNGAISLVDTGLTTGKTYYYGVRAYNAGGWSNWSGSQSAKAK